MADKSPRELSSMGGGDSSLLSVHQRLLLAAASPSSFLMTLEKSKILWHPELTALASKNRVGPLLWKLAESRGPWLGHRHRAAL